MFLAIELAIGCHKADLDESPDDQAVTLDDAAFIVELVNDPDWLQFIGDKAVASEEDARKR